MLDRTRLRDLHGRDLPLHVLEQDYVQAVFLQELYQETESLVYKGGTFLKHAHGLDRFSEDLDFTHDPSDDETVIEQFETAAARLERYGLPATINHVETTGTAIHSRLRYHGPLYTGTDQSRGSISLEVSTRNDISNPTEWRRLFFPYPETRAVTARCLTIEEAFAEKLRALSTRTRGRDLYDCWFLRQQDVRIDKALFEQKMAIVNEPPEVTLSITRHEWERDLAILVEHPPAYDDARHTVTTALTDAAIPVQTTQ